MKPTLALIMSIALGTTISSSLAAATPAKKKPTLAVEAVPLADLVQNCNAIKELATTVIGIRYAGTSLADIHDEINRSFPNKEDEDYKKVFRYILSDAYTQVVYKEKANIQTEQKKFIDRYHFLCSATYKGF